MLNLRGGVRHLIIGVLRAEQNEICRVAVNGVFGEKFFCGVKSQVARRFVRRHVSALHADFFYKARVDEPGVIFNRRRQV